MNTAIKFLKSLVFQSQVLRKISSRICADTLMLPDVLVKTPPDALRNIFSLPCNKYGSQLNQDIFALLFNRFKSGYFVEIGANSGFELSNTIYLEECFGWDGILVEANPRYLPDLLRRRARVVNKAVTSSNEYVEFIDAGVYGGVASTIDKSYEAFTGKAERIRVSTATLRGILDDNEAPNVIDFISIDVEGGELPIVREMCSLDGYRFSSGCIEHNYRKKEFEVLKKTLSDAGYKIIWEGQTGHDLFFLDSNLKRLTCLRS
jgi:FkbM family methyltransferase